MSPFKTPFKVIALKTRNQKNTITVTRKVLMLLNRHNDVNFHDQSAEEHSHPVFIKSNKVKLDKKDDTH